jgi:hypothetical protein
MYRRFFLAFAVMLAMVGSAAPSLAQVGGPPPPPPPGYYNNGVRPLDRILPGVRSGYPGQFYDAEGPYPDAAGNLHYRLKWMTPDGRIIWLDADARTGKVLGPARDNWRQGQPAVQPPGGFYGYRPPGQFGYGMRPPPGRFPGWGGFRGWGRRGGWRPRG